MFAHQVIEDLKNHLPRGKLFDQHLIEKIIYHIKCAQKFHFGNSYGLDGLLKDRQGKPVFNEQEFARFPYQTCWFDYIVEDESEKIKGKRGFLIFHPEKNLLKFIVITFFYGINLDYWHMSNVLQVVEPGASKDNVYREELFKYFNGYSEMNQDIFLATDLSLVERSIMLLNCKNIIAEKIFAPEKLNKKRIKHGKQELFDYHILNVLIPNYKHEYQEKREPLFHLRLHFCRGHFKHYTTEHPLFGKLTGMYWWQPHVRGKAQGFVEKDYNIKVPSVIKEEIKILN